MHFIEQAILSTVKLMPERPIAIAYSGGVDSQVLLYAISQLKQRGDITNEIVACHIHHGLSRFADDWQVFCRQQAEMLNVGFITANVELKIAAQQSVEAIAREARYKAFNRLLPENSVILTGHHLDDQAETVLLALKRGAGVAGLSAMKSLTCLFDREICRPLLAISREQIEYYASTNDIEFIEDDSNTNEQFDRNFIRHQIMPVLSERWQSITHTIARSAMHCQQSQALLDELAQQDQESACNHDSALSIDKLMSLSLERRNNLLRFVLKCDYDVVPSSAQLHEINMQMNAQGDKTPEVRISDIIVRRFQQALYFTPVFGDVSHWSYTFAAEQLADVVVELPDNIGRVEFNDTPTNCTEKVQVLAPKDGQQVELRFTHNNPKCLPDYRNHSKELKKILQELKIAPWQRKRIPFLYYDDELVAAVGYFVCKPFAPNTSSTNLTLNYYFEQDSR